MKERIIFLRQAFKNIARNGAITPSSKFLAKQMVKKIDWKSIHTVIELGAGTGIFTQYILKHALPNTKIIVIEIDDIYVKFLQDKFGDKIILEKADVKDIESIRQKHHIQKIDLIISALPIEVTKNIHTEIKKYIGEGTIFRGATYQPWNLKKGYTGFKTRTIGFTLINIPPARIYSVS